MAAEPGLTLTLYTPEPGSSSAERMMLLASWAASHRAELGFAESHRFRRRARGRWTPASSRRG